MEIQNDIKWRFYATLLDSFQNYLNSEVIWEQYWGWSENPPHTPEEFKQKQFQDLIDRINRVPFDSEAASKVQPSMNLSTVLSRTEDQVKVSSLERYTKK